MPARHAFINTITICTVLCLVACGGGGGGGGGGGSNGGPTGGGPTTGANPPEVTVTTPITDAGPEVLVDITVTDPTGGTPTYLWELVNGPALQVYFADDTVEDPTVTFPFNGTYQLKVTVTGDGGTNTKSVNVTVNNTNDFTIGGDVEDGGSEANGVDVTLIWEPTGGQSFDVKATQTASGAFSFDGLIGTVDDFSVKVHGN